MTFLEKLDLIKRIDSLIKKKPTGQPKDLAEKIGVAESTLYNILCIMKGLGADIEYSKNQNSYYYINDGYFEISFIKSKIK